MEESLLKLPVDFIDKLGESAPETQSIQVRIVNDVYNTPHKVTEYLDSKMETECFSDGSTNGTRLRIHWGNIQGNIEPFTWNVNLLEVLLNQKVCHRQFVVIGKDLTVGEFRAELVD